MKPNCFIDSAIAFTCLAVWMRAFSALGNTRDRSHNSGVIAAQSAVSFSRFDFGRFGLAGGVTSPASAGASRVIGSAAIGSSDIGSAPVEIFQSGGFYRAGQHQDGKKYQCRQ